MIGLITGFPIQLLLFKRKTYYEDKKSTHLHRGGKLIISNHYNFLDYVLTSFIVFPRKLNVVAGEAPFKSGIVRLGMKFFGAIQANRETKSMGFMDESAKRIQKGQLVQIFPEGRNTPDGKIHEFKKSYIVIAYRAKAHIVPIVSDGNFGLFKRTSVMIGKEIDVSEFITSNRHTPTREELERANEYIHGKVLEMREELERRKRARKKK
ncbi:MAG: 1-acyl-sn-glycerol-3-phosphate acyltransferase [Clostridia bacterium]|nr:1-acyl-sn-glycerol-3-phosphate acyltransferase [Clostridia bacterium]